MDKLLVRNAPAVVVALLLGSAIGSPLLGPAGGHTVARFHDLDAVRPAAAHSASTSGWSAEAHSPVESPLLVLLAPASLEMPAPVEPTVESPVEAASPAPGGSVASSPPTSGGECSGDTDCFLACTRAHESDSAGGYGAVSAGGQYHGAYQFLQSTWDAAVAGAGHDEYVGVPADSVPPEVQDAAAAHLYSEVGSRPWGGRC
jgi:hypothetical protein